MRGGGGGGGGTAVDGRSPLATCNNMLLPEQLPVSTRPVFNSLGRCPKLPVHSHKIGHLAIRRMSTACRRHQIIIPLGCLHPIF